MELLKTISAGKHLEEDEDTALNNK